MSFVSGIERAPMGNLAAAAWPPGCGKEGEAAKSLDTVPIPVS